MAWPTLPSAWSNLTKVAASDIALLLDAWAHLGADWVTDTPTLTADTTNPTGWTTWALYREVANSLDVQMGFYGNGGDFGSGDYRLALPGSHTVTGALQGQTLVGGAYVRSATVGVGAVYARFVSSTEMEFECVEYDGTRTVVDDNRPWVGSSTSADDYLFVAGTIEVD